MFHGLKATSWRPKGAYIIHEIAKFHLALWARLYVRYNAEALHQPIRCSTIKFQLFNYDRNNIVSRSFDTFIPFSYDLSRGKVSQPLYTNRRAGFQTTTTPHTTQTNMSPLQIWTHLRMRIHWRTLSPLMFSCLMTKITFICICSSALKRISIFYFKISNTCSSNKACLMNLCSGIPILMNIFALIRFCSST